MLKEPRGVADVKGHLLEAVLAGAVISTVALMAALTMGSRWNALWTPFTLINLARPTRSSGELEIGRGPEFTDKVAIGGVR